MKLIIAGGRDYLFSDQDREFLNSLKGITEVVSGAAPGADAQGEEWAESKGIPVRRFPADWKAHGRGAGPIRNVQMAEYADAVALFPGGRGTDSMRREAKRRGLTVFEATKQPLYGLDPAALLRVGMEDDEDFKTSLLP